MKELKGIKIEDLNVTKETFIELIRLLKPDLVIPDDEHIQFSKSYTKGTSFDMIFYHLLVYSDKLYCFSLCFCFSDLGNDVTLTVGTGNGCNTLHFPFDYLYESEILKPVNEVSTEMIEAELEQPVEEDAEEQENPELTEEYNHQTFELTPLERIIFRERDTCIERYSLFSEKAEEAENDDEYDNYRFDASVAIRIADYLEYIIMEVGLTEKWYSWLQERQKQEALTIL